MKKLFFTLLTLSLLCTVMFFLFTPKETKKHQSAIALKEKDTKSEETSVDKIIATDPSTISEEQFYKDESEIIAASQGSGGYFLDTDAINWILKVEDIFNKRGIKLKDGENRHSVIAWSYFSGANEQYDKALEEFTSIKDQDGIEMTEWVINNKGKGMQNGIVKIKEYNGKIPREDSGTAQAENDRYLFIAYFRGPIYRYDKKKNSHAFIYYPDDQYNWSEDLKLENEKLVINLRDGAGTFAFNNATNKLSQLDKKISATKV